MAISKIKSVVSNISAVIILVFAFIGLKDCSSDMSEGDDLMGDITVDTMYVAVSDTVPSYVPQIKFEKYVVHDTTYLNKEIIINKAQVFSKEDTLKLIKDYFQKRTYVDSLKTDYGYVYLEDVIWKNKIESRKYHYSFEIPEITITKELIKEPRAFNIFAGTEVNIPLKDNRYNVLSNELISPQIYLGAKMRIHKYHNINVEGDILRKELRIGYGFKKGRFNFNSQYSTKLNMINSGIKIYLLK